MRIPKAQSLIEVTVGIIVLVPVVLILLDLSIILYGVQLNDTTCRNAVRAAASGDMSEARSRALAVVERSNRGQNQLISNFHLLLPLETKIAGERPFNIHSSNSPETDATVKGTISATTEVDIRPFAVHHIYGGKSPLQFRATQSFPINYTQETRAETAAASY